MLLVVSSFVKVMLARPFSFPSSPWPIVTFGATICGQPEPCVVGFYLVL